MAQRVRGRDRHGQDHASGALTSRHLARDARGGPGGQPVVHDHGDPAVEVLALAATAQACRPRVQYGAFPLLDRRELTRRDLRPGQQVLVEHPGAALSDGTHGELGLEREAELADHDDVQGCVERVGHLVGDRHPSARQTQHHDVLAAQVLEMGGQLASGLDPVGEHAFIVIGGAHGTPVTLVPYRPRWQGRA